MDLLNANDVAGEYPASYYTASAQPLERFAPLQSDETCDVCVVGAGYTGLSTALHLAQNGYDVILLDAQRLGFGASGRNGGQVGSGQRIDQDDLEKMLDKPQARQLWEIAEESKALVQQLIKDHNIQCAYKPGILHAELKPKHLHHTYEYAQKLKDDYGYDKIETLDATAINEQLGTDVYCGGSIDWGAGHLHPLNFALGLARACLNAGVRIFEQSRVRQIKRGETAQVHTEQGKVSAKFVALGANGYLGNLEPEVASRVMPINNFMIATRPLGKELARSLIRDDIGVVDSKFVVNYYRLSEDHRLLFGGGENYSYKFPDDIAAKAHKPMLEIFPQLKDTPIDFAWGGTLGITVNRLPDFRRLAPNIFSASGYSGHGVAMATLAGKLMAQAIGGTAQKFDIMAQVPTKRFPGGMVMRLPLLVLAMSWFALRDRL